jgi:hypothetical protein
MSEHFRLEWTGVSAVEIKADGNFETNPYIAALMDLTEGAPNGTFMSLLVRDLIAKTAMIEYVQAQLIQVQNAIFGGERFVKYKPENGPAYVSDQGSDKTGFKLADGKLIASNAEISGIINANGGDFNNITITGKSSFFGNIYSNALISTDEIVSPGVTKTFSSNNRVRDVAEYFGRPGYDVAADWNDVFNVTSGSYGTNSYYQNLIRIEINYEVTYRSYDMILYFANGLKVYIYADSSNLNPTIKDTLIIGGGASGKKLRFIGVPQGGNDNTYEQGTVWVDSSGVLHLKL